MRISVTQATAEKTPCDLLVLGMCEGAVRLGGVLGTLDKVLGGALVQEMAAQHFEGKPRQLFVMHTRAAIPARAIAVVGLGRRRSITREEMRRAAGLAVARARELSAKKVALTLVADGAPALGPYEAASAATEGLLLARYQFVTYKTEGAEERERKTIDEALLVEVDKRKIPAAERGVEEARLQSEAVCLVRDLVNEPASRMTPTRLLDEAKRIAELPGVTLEYLDRDQAAARGMEAFLGVARGSEEAPYFIHLSYRPRAQGLKKRLVLVGKGITFDSGGLSLKPSEHMEDMKIDMAGAAVVLGVFQLLPKLKMHLEVHGLIPATENMPSGKAQKPGDIVRTISGKTIEVLNTDAEGRLALADAFGYALELKPDAIVDLATLTGACMVALGEEVAGLFSTDRRLARKLLEAAAAAGERVWELPLAKEYEELVKSEVADYKNITKSRYGGAITAAIFLKQFTGEVPWAHIDIAGPAWQERGDNPVVPKGATGFGVRTMVEFLKRF